MSSTGSAPKRSSAKRPGKKPFAVVLDWDGVVFDTRLLKDIVAKALIKEGCPPELFEATVRAAIGRAAGYTPARHGRLLAKKLARDAEEIARSIYKAIERHPAPFAFPDARTFLEEAARRNFPADVLTAGDREFQEYKMLRSELQKAFRDVHVVPAGKGTAANKIAVLKKLARDHERLWFLDDRPATIRAILDERKLRETVAPILVWRRKEARPRGLRMVRRLDWREVEKVAY